MNRTLLFAMAGPCLVAAAAGGPLEVGLVREETIDFVASPENGASPLWSFGSSIMVRDDDRLFLSLLRPDPGFEPYCNAHWELWQRDDRGWAEVHRGGEGREREPCPIGLLGEDEVVLSIQPGIMPKPFGDGHGDVPWFCQPGLFVVNTGERDNQDNVYRDLQPVLPAGSVFSQHSYRGLGVDRVNREILLLILEQTDETYQPTWMNQAGQWTPLPLLAFPIRACYPQVVLRDRAAHVLAIGDIVEPVVEWQQFKRETLGREWDYVFRRLFHAWSPDLDKEGFRPPLEVDSVEATAGAIRNLDLLVDGDGRAHILYLKRPYQYAFMRDRYFPGEPMTVSLELAVVEQGEVVTRRTLRTGSAEEDLAETPEAMKLNYGRFHPLPDGSLGVVYSGSWQNEFDQEESGLFLARLSADGLVVETVRLQADRPLTGAFFTNTPRSGSDVGPHLDLIGAFRNGNDFEMRYLGYEIR